MLRAHQADLWLWGSYAIYPSSLMVPGGDGLGQGSVWTQVILRTGQLQHPAQPVAGKGQGPDLVGSLW